MGKIVKARHWACVVYPDSAPPDWMDMLKLSGLQCAISPLHDKDEHSDPAVEDGKKPHWHVILCWGNTTTYNAVKTVTDRLNATIPVKLESVKGYYRYFTHADDPDKYQYNPADIQHVGGFDIADHTDLTRGERRRLIGEVQDYIRQYDLTEYADLLDSLRDSCMVDQWDIAASNTLLFRSYLASRRCQSGGARGDE